LESFGEFDVDPGLTTLEPPHLKIFVLGVFGGLVGDCSGWMYIGFRLARKPVVAG
jgi:hypothetical protein